MVDRIPGRPHRSRLQEVAIRLDVDVYWDGAGDMVVKPDCSMLHARPVAGVLAEGGVIVAVNRERATAEYAEFDAKERSVRVGAGGHARVLRF